MTVLVFQGLDFWEVSVIPELGSRLFWGVVRMLWPASLELCVSLSFWGVSTFCTALINTGVRRVEDIGLGGGFVSQGQVRSSLMLSGLIYTSSLRGRLGPDSAAQCHFLEPLPQGVALVPYQVNYYCWHASGVTRLGHIFMRKLRAPPLSTRSL